MLASNLLPFVPLPSYNVLQIPEVVTGGEIFSKWHLVKGQIQGGPVGERLNNSKEVSDHIFFKTFLFSLPFFFCPTTFSEYGHYKKKEKKLFKVI